MSFKARGVFGPFLLFTFLGITLAPSDWRPSAAILRGTNLKGAHPLYQLIQGEAYGASLMSLGSFE